VLLVLAICAGFMVPAVASAGNYPAIDNKALMMENGWTQVMSPGKANVEWDVIPFGLYGDIDVILDNGEKGGKNRVPRVKIALVDREGKVKEVILKFNKGKKHVGNTRTTIYKKDLLKLAPQMKDAHLQVKIAGKKSNRITLTLKCQKGRTFLGATDPPPTFGF
jgi:hypothetical protein